MSAELPPLDADVLIGAAQHAAGSDNWGEDMTWVEGLRIMVDDLVREADLNEAGVAAQVQDILRLLINRLGIERDIAEHPEIEEEVLESPIVIIGLPRTGTSKLQRTIAADPGFQRLEVWRLLMPARIAGVPEDATDPRIAIGEQFEALLRSVPGFMEAHPMEAHEPDEELWLMDLAFASAVPSHRLHLPNHRTWIADRQDYAYAYARRVLKYLQWQDGGALGRPWVLKSPVHVGQLSLLRSLYPDATFVHLHRNPFTVLGSYCSLIAIARGMNCDEVDRPSLGPEFTPFWAREVERGLAARSGVEVMDVGYNRLTTDFGGVLREIYERAGRPVTSEVAAAWAEYDTRRPAGYFGSHLYDPAAFGVTRELTDREFARYLDAFPELTR